MCRTAACMAKGAKDKIWTRESQGRSGASPDISHYLCPIEQFCATVCLLCGARAAPRRQETRGRLGLFRGCGGSEEGVSVGLWVMPRGV